MGYLVETILYCGLSCCFAAAGTVLAARAAADAITTAAAETIWDACGRYCCFAAAVMVLAAHAAADATKDAAKRTLIKIPYVLECRADRHSVFQALKTARLGYDRRFLKSS